MTKISKISGFTLIELLVVIAIIGILSTILVISINPGHTFAKARDTERETDLVAILSSVTQYASEHSGALPDTDGDPDTSNFPTAETCIGTSPGCFDLAGAGDDGEHIVPVYMASMPYDPDDEFGSDGNTGYTIYQDENGRLVATATNPETVESISLTR